jgi:hypothetical protein
MTMACGIVETSSADSLEVIKMLLFVLGLLLGVLIGGALCARYVRREMTANVAPQLRQLGLKVETLESVLNLALLTRQTELTSTSPVSTRSYQI